MSLGKTMLIGMEEGSDAERYVDEKLLEIDSRLSDLVTPVKGKLDCKEKEVGKVRSLSLHAIDESISLLKYHLAGHYQVV